MGSLDNNSGKSLHETFVSLKKGMSSIWCNIRGYHRYSIYTHECLDCGKKNKRIG